MKKLLVMLLACAAASVGTAQDKNLVVIGKVDSLNSAILKENRKILVSNPGTAANAIFQKQTYPVVYVLDGDAHFNSVVGMIQQLSNNGVIPEMIVVAIPNTNRTRDLTPTKVKPEPPFMPAEMAAQTGGGDNFLSFMEKELFPYIESKYPAAPYRIFIGHSLGGLMVMDALVHHQNMFNSYIAIDPSMWYDNDKLLKQVAASFQNNSYAGTSLYVGMANTMERSMNIETVSKDTTMMSRHIRSIIGLTNHLEDAKKNNLRVSWKYYPNDSHNSVPLIVEYDALRFLFKDYLFDFSMTDFADPKADVATLMSQHYFNVSGILGYTIKPPETNVNMMGYQMMEMKQLDKAEALFKLNTVNYPESGNTYDSLGDLYLAKDQKAKAIESFQKALALSESAPTREKLNELLAKKK